MLLYETQKRNGLERCISDADIRYSTCPEALAIWDPAGGLIDGVQHEIVRTVNGCLIQFADEEYIGLYEDFLYLHYDGERELEQRRSNVMELFMADYHIGEPEIKDIFGLYTKAPVTADLVGGSVIIKVNMRDIDPVALDDVWPKLRRRIPAHLGIKIFVYFYHRQEGRLPISAGAGFWHGIEGDFVLLHEEVESHVSPRAAIAMRTRDISRLVREEVEGRQRVWPAYAFYETQNTAATHVPDTAPGHAAFIHVSHTSKTIKEDD